MKTLKYVSYIYAALGPLLVLHNLLVYLSIFEYEQDSALMAGISDYYWPGVFVYTTGIGLMLIFWHRKKHSRNGVVIP